MQPDSAARLWEARDAGRRVQELVADRTWDDYHADPALRWAVERGFTIIGEALAQLRRADPDTAQQISRLPEIVGFRNVLVHGYAGVDDATVWHAATTDVGALIVAIDAIIGPA